MKMRVSTEKFVVSAQQYCDDITIDMLFLARTTSGSGQDIVIAAIQNNVIFSIRRYDFHVTLSFCILVCHTLAKIDFQYMNIDI
jgi:hypothetical protein